MIKLLSNFAFNCNLRHYTKEEEFDQYFTDMFM